MRPWNGFLWNFWGVSGFLSIRWDQKLIWPPERYAWCFAAIKHGKFYKNLKKLFQSHPKDFAVRQKLAEIFVVQCDSDPTFDRDQFSSTSRLSNPHWPNDDWCVRCLLIPESPKTPGHYRYQFWVLGYIPYTGLLVFSLRFLVFLCILRFRIFQVGVLNASE